MTLPNDICRCLGSNCGEANTCERYLQRDTGGERTPFADTMRSGDECAEKIEREEAK